MGDAIITGVDGLMSVESVEIALILPQIARSSDVVDRGELYIPGRRTAKKVRRIRNAP